LFISWFIYCHSSHQPTILSSQSSVQPLTFIQKYSESQEEWLTEFAFQGSVLNFKNYPSHPDSFKEEKNVM
jgi:hypothetical protein